MKRSFPDPSSLTPHPFFRKGQSLVEVMVALFVLTTGFLGILGLLSQSIFLSKTVSQETTATYLASEGIEIAKSLIDHDVYSHLAGVGTGWNTCFGASTASYELDYTTTTCPPRAFSSQDFLEYNPNTHHYLYSYNDTTGGGVPTTFTRDIKVIPGATEITVQSIVTWNNGMFAYQTVELEDHFYNWLPS